MIRSHKRRTWRQLSRADDGRLLAGVCAGFAHHLGIDVTLLRLAFSLLSLASGLGVLVYLALWLALPTEGMETNRGVGSVARANLRHFRRELRGSGQRLSRAWHRTSHERWPRPLSRRWLAIGLVAIGAAILSWSFGLFAWLNGTRIIGLVALLVGVGTLISLSRGGHE